jgi:hypothetical protein
MNGEKQKKTNIKSQLIKDFKTISLERQDVKFFFVKIHRILVNLCRNFFYLKYSKYIPNLI